VVSSAGDVILEVFNGSPTGGALLGYSWNGLSTTPYNTVSFISSFTGPVTIVVATTSLTGASYTLQAFDGNLSVGTARTASTYNNSINYSFDAVSGTAYQVRLTPQTGNVDIGSVNAKLTTSVGSSTLSGTSMDTVTFLAPATQRYYVKVSPASVGTTFNIQVVTTSTNPDLAVVVDSAVSDGTNVTVNYTVHNQGIDAAGAFGVTGWSDSASAPTVGSTGQTSSPSYASLAGGASVSGTFIIPNSTASGTAYAIVDTANAVVETNENNNVSAGKAWQKPLIAPQSFDFENSVTPASMTMSGNAVWAVDATTGGGSTHSLKAGTITNSQSSCVAMSVANGVSISFDYAVSSEQYYDYLKFYIDGALNYNVYASGTVPWTNSGAISVSSGTHEYRWCYTKDSSGSAGTDTAWIDNIVVTAAPPPTVDLQVAVNSAVSNGSSVTVNYTVSNAGNSASGPFNVDILSNNASVPPLGTIGQSTVPTASLAAGASVSGSVTIANATTAGTAYAIVDTTNTVTETNENNNVSAGKPWTVSIDLQVVINSAVSDRNNVTVNYTVSNPAANPAGPFNVDIWSDSVTVPVVGNTGQSIVTFPSLSAGATASGSVSIPNAGASGTAYAIVDTTNQVAEGIETNNVSPGVAWIEPPLAPQTYNFNTSLVPAEMVMSGNAAWSANTSGKGTNTIYTLKAGTITDSQSTCVAVSTAGSSSIHFDYSVSSELNYDLLYFYIDGVQTNFWSGTVAWTTSTTTTVPMGVHEYKWCYIKDGSAASGSDTAWIDNIVIN